MQWQWQWQWEARKAQDLPLINRLLIEGEETGASRMPEAA
jgi:hypothetical protein